MTTTPWRPSSPAERVASLRRLLVEYSYHASHQASREDRDMAAHAVREIQAMLREIAAAKPSRRD